MSKKLTGTHLIVFDAPVGQRILNSGFHGIRVMSPDISSEIDVPCWWSQAHRRWYRSNDTFTIGMSLTNFKECNSFKAFIRHIRNHPELLRFDLKLESKYENHDVYAKSLYRSNYSDLTEGI